MSTEIKMILHIGNIGYFDLSKYYYVKIRYLIPNIRPVA